MDAGVCCLDHSGLDAENFVNPFGCEYLGGRAVGDDAAITHHQDLIGETGGEVEIVHDADGNHISTSGETLYPLHEIDLVTNVEKR